MPGVAPAAPFDGGTEGTAAAAYDAFAPFYDGLTAQQDHDWWWSVMLPPAQAAGLKGTRVLDVACGTGKSLLPLVRSGWTATGVDASRGMLAEAERKLGGDVPLLVHDMRALPRLGEFDLVSSLNDAVNNVLDEQQLLDTFSGFRRNLAPGGVVVFDLNTLATFRGYADHVLAQQDAERIVIVEGVGAEDLPPGGTLRLDFHVLQAREAFFWHRSTRSHRQRHHPEAEVRRALAATGLELVEVRGLLRRSLDEQHDEQVHEKAIYFARATS